MGWSWLIDGIKGSVAGASAGFMIGGPWGAVIGGVVGGVAGNVEGYYADKEKDEMEDKQRQGIEASNHNAETTARRQARMAYEAAMNNPAATSDSLFTKTSLQRQKDTNFASIRDKGNPFTASDEKKPKHVAVAPQFYGKVA